MRGRNGRNDCSGALLARRLALALAPILLEQAAQSGITRVAEPVAVVRAAEVPAQEQCLIRKRGVVVRGG